MKRFDRAQCGDEWHFSQAALQAQTDAAKAYHLNKLSNPDTRHESSTDNRLIHVRNNIGTDVDAFCVVSIDSSAAPLLPTTPLIVKAKGIVYAGIKPVTNKKIAVVQHKIKSADVGVAVLYGVTAAYIDVIDVDHRYCNVVNGQYRLESTDDKTSIEILWHEGSVGAGKEAIIEIDGGVPNLVPFKLREVLYPLGEAKAIVFHGPKDCDNPPATLTHIMVRDVIDIMAPQIDPDSLSGSIAIREKADVNSCGWAKITDEKTPDHWPIYDIVSLGGFCCGTSPESYSSYSFSSPSPSSSSPSSTISSVPSSQITSESGPVNSESNPVTSESWSVPSGSTPVTSESWSAPSGSVPVFSESGSIPSSPVLSESGSLSVSSPVLSESGSIPSSQVLSGSGSLSGGTSKSTAIVEASWTPGKYVALYVSENPDVRFDDVLTIFMPCVNSKIVIDPRYIEVCEPDTIVVCGWSSTIPLTGVPGLEVIGRFIHITFLEEDQSRSLKLTLRTSAIRKDFKNIRFQEKTRADYDANEAFLRGAHPK